MKRYDTMTSKNVACYLERFGLRLNNYGQFNRSREPTKIERGTDEKKKMWKI